MEKTTSSNGNMPMMVLMSLLVLLVVLIVYLVTHLKLNMMPLLLLGIQWKNGICIKVVSSQTLAKQKLSKSQRMVEIKQSHIRTNTPLIDERLCTCKYVPGALGSASFSDDYLQMSFHSVDR